MSGELEKLNQDIEKAEAKLRQAEHKEKILQCQVKKLTRKERTHRLCTRGAMLESYFPNPESVSDEQIGIILNILFHRSDTGRIIEQALAENWEEGAE